VVERRDLKKIEETDFEYLEAGESDHRQDV